MKVYKVTPVKTYQYDIGPPWNRIGMVGESQYLFSDKYIVAENIDEAKNKARKIIAFEKCGEVNDLRRVRDCTAPHKFRDVYKPYLLSSSFKIKEYNDDISFLQRVLDYEDFIKLFSYHDMKFRELFKK